MTEQNKKQGITRRRLLKAGVLVGAGAAAGATYLLLRQFGVIGADDGLKVITLADGRTIG